MQREWQCRTGGQWFGGVVVVAVGVILLLNNLNIIEARTIFRVWFWPLAIIGFGIVQLLRRRINP